MTRYRALGKDGKVLAEASAPDLLTADERLVVAVEAKRVVPEWKATHYAVDELEGGKWVRVAGDEQ